MLKILKLQNRSYISGQGVKKADISINTAYYMCGPPLMMDAVLNHSIESGVGKSLITLQL